MIITVSCTEEMSPCCNEPWCRVPYAFSEPETGYRDAGDRWRCTECGAIYEENEIEPKVRPADTQAKENS